MRQVIFDPWIASHQRPNGALFSVNSSVLPRQRQIVVEVFLEAAELVIFMIKSKRTTTV